MFVFMTYLSLSTFKDCGRRISRHVCGMQGIGIHGARLHEVTAAVAISRSGAASPWSSSFCCVRNVLMGIYFMGVYGGRRFFFHAFSSLVALMSWRLACCVSGGSVRLLLLLIVCESVPHYWLCQYCQVFLLIFEGLWLKVMDPCGGHAGDRYPWCGAARGHSSKNGIPYSVSRGASSLVTPWPYSLRVQVARRVGAAASAVL